MNIYLQKVTDIVNGLREQGGFGVNDMGTCQYFNPNTHNRCAMGLIMPIELATQLENWVEVEKAHGAENSVGSIEGLLDNEVWGSQIINAIGLPKNDFTISFCDTAQIEHDNIAINFYNGGADLEDSIKEFEAAMRQWLDSHGVYDDSY